ncbi:MAG: UDP-N-acetylmuramoyl-tripeptide--D-alanyl-D-alanine ligase [Bacteroidales bacterium]|nr:UDP-N-acetylmuramoyl-tripeptide--D-alanyl-D-alanine ligase [Bacteroidales bacterium]
MMKGTIEHIYEKYKECDYSVCTDTRNLLQNSLFIALKGERFDAHQFIDYALENGCKYAIAEYYEGKNENVIIVENTLETLQCLSQYHRNNMPVRVIGIAGSNGKTTTKELAAAVMSKKFQVSYTKGNYNNHIGVPLTLLQIRPNTEFAIVEMGANHPDELELLCKLANPDYGIVTNLGKEHLGYFGSFDAVVRTETYLFQYLKNKNGVAFVNADDEILMKKSQGIKRFLYGNNESCDVRLIEKSNTPFLAIAWKYKDENKTYRLQSRLVGFYNADNIMAAICMGKYFNISESNMIEAIETYTPNNHRSQWIKQGSNVIIMDAYNANPSSMELAIQSFLDMKLPNKVLILGDMLELGKYEDDEHKAILERLKNNHDIEIYLVGHVFNRVKSEHVKSSFLTVEELISYLKKNPIQNSSILIKGSHGIHLEKLLDVF